MVPITDDMVPAAPLALYQPGTHDRHPLASVRLGNDTESGLPPGVLTLYERNEGATYVGDARLASLPAGDERLLSFAVDRKILVDRTSGGTRNILSGAIAEGVLRLKVARRETTTYRLKSSDQRARNVLIEHPRQAEWRLVSPELDNVEMTDSALRLPLTIAGGASRSFEVTTEQISMEQYGLIGMPLNRMQAFAVSEELGPKLRQAFDLFARLRRSVEKAWARIEALEAQREGIFGDQDRLRDNLVSVPSDSDLHRRYLAKLTDQENALDTLEVAMKKALEARAAAESSLANAIADLDI
jgi:hypothetical protein